MTAYSFQEWSDLSSEEQTRMHGVSVPRDHEINNPNRGVYWSGTSSASALAVHLRETLTGNDRDKAQRTWATLKQMHRKAVETPKNVDRAMGVRHVDAERALENSSFNLTDKQMTQIHSISDDTYRIMEISERAGLDHRRVASALMDRAAGLAVTTDNETDREAQALRYANNMRGAASNDMSPEAIAFPDANEGVRNNVARFFAEDGAANAFQNLAQSTQQLYSLIRTNDEELDGLEMDALDQASSMGTEFSEEDGEKLDNTISDTKFGRDATDAENIDFIRGILRSIPLERNPQDVQRAENFSVRMDTLEEAKFVETMLRWVGEHEEMPRQVEINNAFASWRDTGLIADPYNQENTQRMGLIVGQGNTANDMAEAIIDSIPRDDVQFVVLTANSDTFVDGAEVNGRPVINVTPTATPAGVKMEGAENAPRNAILAINMTNEESRDNVSRSLAANAFVGSSTNVAYLAGPKLLPYEAQAIHIAGTARKLTTGMGANGNEMTNKDMRELRSTAQQVDRDADPNRYFTAGHARPYEGVYGVVFDGARNYDAANRKYAPGRDIMAEGYARIPSHGTILTTDNSKHAAYKWLEEHATDRGFLYAEAERKLSFAKNHNNISDREVKTSREAETELRLYERPRNEREYGKDEFNRTVCKDEAIEWTDPRVRGAIILVTGNTQNDVLNGAAQATKVAQEAILDRAHTGVIFDDMQTDFHAAHLTRLAVEMGKSVTIFNKEGETVDMSQARELTKRNAQSLSKIDDLEVRDRMRGSINGLGNNEDLAKAERRNASYAFHEPVGQMALSALPKMNDQIAAKLKDMNLTLEEIYTDRSKEMQEALYKAGMPSETVRKLGDTKVWEKAIETALLNQVGANRMPGTTYKSAGESSLLPENKAGFVYGGHDGSKVVAMIGNNAPSFDGSTSKPVDPEDLIDREQIRGMIKTFASQGMTIATTLEEGVGKVVMEEAVKVPEAKVIVATPGNPMAASPELRMLASDLDDTGRLTMVMPANIAPYYRSGDEGMMSDRYVDNRSAMHDIIAHVADAGVVVQAAAKDQSMHMVDKMNQLDKPIAAVVPANAEDFGAAAYSGNLKLMRGAGQASIESLSLVESVQARGYANITDTDTSVSTYDGVTRGNAGTFESVKIVRNDMSRSGHSYKTMGWGAAAPALGTEASVERFATSVKEEQAQPLGQFKEMSVRELEKRSVERWAVSESTREAFNDQQKKHETSVMQEAAYGDFGMTMSR